MKSINKLTRALATWYPGMQSILVKDFQRNSLTEEDCLRAFAFEKNIQDKSNANGSLETLGFL